ncbi:MAG: hypothetical protein RLZZ219_1245 [Cyanobacteriota bacterium]
MKPHQLRIEAFGPYAEPAAIDFDALSDEGLFLIHGTTGAGKTFLLDALCFALYGEVSGDRNVRALKSHHAGPAAVPQVQLEFSCGGGRYRVERRPAHTAPRARGRGFTEKAAQAVLWRVNGSGAEPVASRVTEVTREVERLVGLNSGQFRQVILLPQGRFAEVLRAGAEEREALLKTLFDTLGFEQAGLWLDDQARGARQELAEQTRGLEVLHRQAVQTWSPFAAGAADRPAGATDPRTEAAAEPASQEPPTLDQLRDWIAAVVEASGSRLRQATAALEAAQRSRAAIDRQADRWDQRSGAMAKLAELEGKAPVVEDYRQRLQRAERAESLRASLEAEALARLERQQLQSSGAARLGDTIRIRAGVRGLPPVVQRLALDALPSLEVLGAARTGLAARRAEVAVLGRRALEGRQARAAADEASRLAAAAAAAVSAGRAAIESRQQERQSHHEAFLRACTARDQLSGLQQAAREAQGRAAATEALTEARARERQALAGRDAAEARLRTAQSSLQELRRRQINGMAARLAGTLTAGGACPVCGSSHHPDPARPSQDAVADAAVSAAESELNAATSAASRAAADLAALLEERRGLEERAGATADGPSDARAAAREAAAALRSATALADDVGRLERALGESERQLQLLQGTLESAVTEQAVQTRAAEEAARRADALQAEIASELGEGIDPAAVLEGFTAVEAALKELAGCAEASGAAATRHEQAATRLERELLDTDFVDAAAVREALREESWRLQLRERIAGYERQLNELRGVLASSELADLPEQRPDTAAAEAAMTSADAARTAAVERHSEARTARGEIERLAAEHQEASARRREAGERAALLNAVADRCTGRTAPYISLQRWVLSAHLAEICRHANQRLELMTSGRYQLRLTDEGGRGGRNAGLGLRVLDAYTGEEREVSSLSGGETFQASLALALGVADTVQAHAGGVHLDALFIDEGFGSLDPDSLQLAMDELDRLRAGGRMIGVISHVAALRERIRAGIAITAGTTGSRLSVSRSALS